MSPPSRTDLAWAAGLFDGEGSVAIESAQTNPGLSVAHRLIVELTNTHMPTLVRFQMIVGAGFIKRCGPDVYRVTARSQKALQILNLLAPHVYTKKEQVELALEFSRLPRSQGRKLTAEMLSDRQGFAERLSALKRVA